MIIKVVVYKAIYDGYYRLLIWMFELGSNTIKKIPVVIYVSVINTVWIMTMLTTLNT